ncbi:MAG: DUF29 domain-containing protein [Proteobacteria bacterium]|nr:DUF29 domain-containing protein [Pseudomonadota bacterium]
MSKLKARPDLYETDPHAWYWEQATLLRSGKAAQADLVHIAEELEDMGRSEAKELRSSLRLILSHLLKWQHQPDKRSDSWRDTIDRERDHAALCLEDNPSLRSKLPELFAKAYQLARKEATRETKLPLANFRQDPPCSIEQCLDPEYLPR